MWSLVRIQSCPLKPDRRTPNVFQIVSVLTPQRVSGQIGKDTAFTGRDGGSIPQHTRALPKSGDNRYTL